MRRGDFDAAWAVSDEVMRSRQGHLSSHLPRHLQHVWDGTPLSGKRVLIRCYHGLGDTIQFIRFVPQVRALATEVIIWAQPELIPLLRTAPGVDRLEPLHDGAPDVEYDVDVEVMELPYILRTNLSSLPSDIPYLHATRATLAHDGRVKVGLVCNTGNWDRARCIPLELAAPLGTLPGVDVRLLHPNPEPCPPRGISVATGTDTIVGTARIMKGLDLVISVDSMPAHLAGALGVPVWTLLRHGCDWRWMVERDDSPWYPSMRLFRQERPGDWGGVIERVADELREYRVGRAEPIDVARRPAS